MSYILDADWVINALAGQRRAGEYLNDLAPEGIAISWVTVGEIYEGAFMSPNPDAHLAAFRAFLAPFQMLGLNDPIMARFAELRTFLRRRGQLIPDLDLLLGATAVHYDLTVLTYNVRHLQRIPDLRIWQPNNG